MATRIDFATLGPAARLVPVVLVAGINVVLVPAGCAGVTTIATTGSLDSAFWPGAGALGAGVVKPWLDLDEYSFETTARLREGDVEQSTLNLDLLDVDGAVTAALSNRDSGVKQLLAATLAAAGATVTLQSNAGFAAGGGVAYIGREAIAYGGLGVNTLTGCTRGLYGSRDVTHPYDPTRAQVVSSVPQWWMGRRASLWVAQLSADGTTLTDPSLLFLGVVGHGIGLNRDGTKWRVPVDSITEALGRKYDPPIIELYGINHHNGAGPGRAHIFEQDNPLSANFGYAFSATWGTDVVSLTGDAAAPHDGGWHPSWEAFVEAWNDAASGVGNWTNDDPMSLDSQRHLCIYATDPGFTAASLGVLAPWDNPVYKQVWNDSEGWCRWRSETPVPEAWIPLAGTVHVPGAADFAKIPTTLSYSSGTTGTTARWGLSFEYAGRGTICTLQERDAATQNVQVASEEPSHNWRHLRDYHGAMPPTLTPAATTRVSARLVPTVEGDRFDDVVYRLALMLDTAGAADYHLDSVDWTHLGTVLDANPAIVQGGRIFVALGLNDDTFLSLLSQLARLNGLALCMRHGRITAFRPGNVALTEVQTSTAVTAGDLLEPPELVDAYAPLVTGLRCKLPSGEDVEYHDLTTLDQFGPGDVVELKVTQGLTGSPSDVEARLRGLAWGIITPLGYPWRTVTVDLPHPWLDTQTGGVVALTHPTLPTFVGTRGLVSQRCQVESASLRLFGGRARTRLRLRLAEGAPKGYAPEGLVEAGGLVVGTPDVVLADGSVWGGRCWGQTAASTTADGGAANFRVGDKVALWELDDATPDSQTGFTILAVVGDTITLDGNVNAAMAGHAAASYKVALRYEPYDTSTASWQHDYAFVADSGFTLGAAADAPHRWQG